ncbi:cytochrome P450 [Mangrovihabitans endophyticus]|uniref:Cytochrome P450 n=1 Tax=Mangrovihabitans endophyticus TaxID=1751298 RepID=A0A8J3BWY9_9ACTN|nr:cytochrome P450 [Mangrovihabitans endophyticus]GGK76646.1 cytochrome P450 [Mangrovihabitans endophyticus]
MTGARIPGPRPVPLLGARGNFLAFLTDAVAHLHRLHERYGEVAALARGDTGHVFVFSPRYNRVVLGDPDLFHNLDAASAPVRMPQDSSLRRLYAGLTTMNGEPHHRVRRLVAAALPRRHVETYAGDITDVTARHLAGWHTGDRLDLLAEMRTLTMAVAVKTLLGLEPGADGGPTGRLLQDWMDAVFSVPAMAMPLDVPGLPYHRLQTLSDRLERTVRDLIRRRRAGPSGGRDALARLIHAEERGVRLSDEELVGQTAFLFMAGHATTAAALAWTVLLLCAHPGVLHDLADEVDGALRGAPPDAAGLAALPLLTRVVKESLRLLPPVAWWGKVSTAPCDLGPYRLEAGATVVFSPYVTHRLPELYPEPDRFAPDRWLTCDPGPYEYLPFSAGPRACLGAGFAMLEMRLVLAMLLQRWRPQMRSGARIDRGGLMVLQPRPGLPVTLAPMAGRAAAARLRGTVVSTLDLDGSR